MKRIDPTPQPVVARRVKRWRRLLARGAAGMTLIEIMVVVIIMGLIASAVGYSVFRYLASAKVRTARAEVMTIQSAVRMYQNDHPDTCPTMDQLISEGHIERSTASTDPWGHPFTISCENDSVTVSSMGPDGRPGTPDDINGGQAATAPGAPTQ